MNKKLYSAAASLPPAALTADRGAFFGSVLGTLNHIVAADVIWLRRFMAHPADFSALKAMCHFAVPTSLTHPFGTDLASLRVHREQLDEIIVALASEVNAGVLAKPVSYQNSRGTFHKNFGSLLLHFFNHQTHHRGQASTLLSQAGVDLGVTDLLASIPEYC